MSKEQLQSAIDKLRLSVRSEFVPLSKSRNAGKWESLNWKVTILKDGKDVVTVDFAAGVASCPSYVHAKRTVLQDQKIKFECEEGFQARGDHYIHKGKQIFPNVLDIFSSVANDSDALDYNCFEDWTDSVGFDNDSRKAEVIYKECLRISLALRNSLSESGLSVLKEAAQDY